MKAILILTIVFSSIFASAQQVGTYSSTITVKEDADLGVCHDQISAVMSRDGLANYVGSVDVGPSINVIPPRVFDAYLFPATAENIKKLSCVESVTY